MANALPQDLDWCREYVLAPGSLLSVTLRFAEPDIRDRLVILHTLLRSIRAIPFDVSEPEPAIAKLAWWERELRSARNDGSQHPAVRASLDSGMLARINAADLGIYIQSVARLASGEPIEDQEEWLESAKNIGGSAARMEQALNSAVNSESVLDAGIAEFLCWCLSHFNDKLVGGLWWLPLDVQAKFGQFSPETPTEGRHDQYLSIIGFQAREAIRYIDQLGTATSNNPIPTGIARHLFVCGSVSWDRLHRLAGKPARNWPLRNRPRDTIVAWRSARNHQRQHRGQVAADGESR